MNSGFLIAAASSGSGKTTLALGLMRALSRRGLRVQPFKCGPDYIDTHFHSIASGRDSINLDTFMSTEKHVRDIFLRHASGSDVAVAEGVMGMFDGHSKWKGSSADIASILSIPIILLVNAASTAYSVAATIFGFKNFKPDANIAGVIFNRVASESHYSFLKDACHDAGVECLGFLRRDNSLSVPSRHLGLTISARNDMEKFICAAANAVETGVDIDRLLELTTAESHNSSPDSPLPIPSKRVAVAHDDAFNFIYRTNIDFLKARGYDIIEFSPLNDTLLPDADFVYLPGGYPELYAAKLSSNVSMIESVRNYVEAYGKMWAECGGMIYLSDEIDGIPLCGVLPLKCTMNEAKLTLGYRTVVFDDTVIKGHEFHYSRIVNPEAIPSVAKQYNVKGKEVSTPVYRHKNTFASYTHLYWLEYGN